VDKLEQADLLVSNRFHLKDSGFTLYEVPDKPSAKRQRVVLVHSHAIATFAAATAATALTAVQNNTETPLQQYRKEAKRAHDRQAKAAARAA
jgi:hypothetical protein